MAFVYVALQCGPVSLISRTILAGFLPPRDPGQWMDRVVRSAKPFPPFPDDRGQTDWLLCTPEGVSWRPLDRKGVHWPALFLTHLHPDRIVNAISQTSLASWPVLFPRRQRSRGLRIPPFALLPFLLLLSRVLLVATPCSVLLPLGLGSASNCCFDCPRHSFDRPVVAIVPCIRRWIP